MRALPGWYADEVTRHAKLIIAGEETKDAALISLRVLVRDTHREFGNIVLDDWNAPHLDQAVIEATPRPPRADPDLILRISDAAPRGGIDRAHLAEDKQTEAATQVLISQGIAAASNGVVRLTDSGAAEALRLKMTGYQQALFPGVPLSLRTTPSRRRDVIAMGTHELDTAKAIWEAKIKNAKDGAEAELARLTRLYETVRPLMSGEDTVGDVLVRLAARKTRRASS